MEHFDRAEKLIATISGGSLTPGSGNKGVRGDVCFGNDAWRIEVKSTVNEKITIQRSWLNVLESLADKRNVALVVIFGDLTGCVYYFTEFTQPTQNWKSLTLHKDTNIDELITDKGVWERDDLYSLSNLVQ